MARKKKRPPRPPIPPREPRPAAATPARAPVRTLPRATPTRWWFDFDIARDHLALVRVVFFAVLAVDAFLQINHAPRYGAGGFNVPHFGWLPLPVGREAMLAIDLLLTHLFVLAAFGVATRLVVPLAAALDAYYYFSSQLDSYQHHYLVVLLLVLACFVPWHAKERYVKSWALRLVFVQIALLYLWAAIAKLDPLWLDGSTLRTQLSPTWARDLVTGTIGWAGVSWAILLVELGLAAAWLTRRGTLPALAVGVAFHVGVELAGFRIGQFSYIMLAIYLLLLPSARVRVPRVPAPGGTPAIAALAGGLVVGAILWRLSPVPVGAAVIAIGSAVTIGGFALQRTVMAGAAHLASCLLVFGLAHGTDQAVDYYRYWAGSARRLGDTDEMLAAYRALVAIAPGHGSANYYLGHGALDAGDLERALAHFQRAQAAEPGKARAFVGEARVRIAQGDQPAARAALARALGNVPGDPEATQLLQTLDAPSTP